MSKRVSLAGREALALVSRCQQKIEVMGGRPTDAEMAQLIKINKKLSCGESMCRKDAALVNQLLITLNKVNDVSIVRLDKLLERDFSANVVKLLENMRAGLAAGRSITPYQLRVIERLETGVLPPLLPVGFVLDELVKRRMSWMVKLADHSWSYRMQSKVQHNLDWQRGLMCLTRYSRRGLIQEMDYKLLLQIFEEELKELEQPQFPQGSLITVDPPGYYREHRPFGERHYVGQYTPCLVLTPPDVDDGDVYQTILVDDKTIMLNVSQMRACL